MYKKIKARSEIAPVLGIFIPALTAGGIVLSELGKFPKISFGALRIPAGILGGAMIFFGMIILALGIRSCKSHPKDVEKVTKAIHHSPILGITIICAGAILIYGNAALTAFLPIIFLLLKV